MLKFNFCTSYAGDRKGRQCSVKQTRGKDHKQKISKRLVQLLDPLAQPESEFQMSLIIERLNPLLIAIVLVDGLNEEDLTTAFRNFWFIALGQLRWLEPVSHHRSPLLNVS